MKHRSFFFSMRKDALTTIILIEAICVSYLLYYAFGKIFSWDTGLHKSDAMAAGGVGISAICVYGIFTIIMNLFDQK